MLLLKLVLTILNLELGATTYNGIEGGETKQRYGTHHHGDKLCSIVTSNGDGTLFHCILAIYHHNIVFFTNLV